LKNIQYDLLDFRFITNYFGQVAYYIVTVNHDGEMYVESEPGKGTTFTILLPIRSNP